MHFHHPLFTLVADNYQRMLEQAPTGQMPICRVTLHNGEALRVNVVESREDFSWLLLRSHTVDADGEAGLEPRDRSVFVAENRIAHIELSFVPAEKDDPGFVQRRLKRARE